MKDLLDLNDIARELKVSRRTVQRLANSGELPAITVSRRGGFTYVVPLQSYFEWKRSYKKKKEEIKKLSDIDFIQDAQIEWLEWCKNGLLTGKCQCEKTIELNEYFLDYYFRKLPRRYQRTSIISTNYVRHVLGNIDPKSFSLKYNIYKAVTSFTKYLIAKEICEEQLLNELRKLRPKRLYPPKKVHCSEDQFEELLKEASIRTFGQNEYNVILNKTLVATLGLAGLRGSELCDLKVSDVDLNKRTIYVFHGKGKKNRYVGISDRLYKYLKEYLEVRLKSENNKFFLTVSSLTYKPVALERRIVLRRVKRIAKRVDLDINVHGLRRTFATIAANSGKPINIISLALGHADLKTTQGYLMTSREEVINEMKSW